MTHAWLAAVPVQTVAAVENPIRAIGLLVGMAILAAGLSGAVAFVFRWYTHERVQTGLALLFGLSGVAASLNTQTALGQVIASPGVGPNPLSTTAALFNVSAFLIAGAAAFGAVSGGDRLGESVVVATGGRTVDGEISRVVETVGRVIAVELPGTIEDIVGYDPVPADTKAQLAGHTFLFPRRLTVADLESRLVTRLKTEYDVGHVDVDLASDGSVEYLALGARAAGIGPTLPPETSAVAITADPAFAAGAGDLVQVWDPETNERVTTAELRGVADDVVTLAVDTPDASLLDEGTPYRLVTLPVEPRADRAFASLLRAADETMSVVTVREGSLLAGQPVGSVAITIVAIRTSDGTVETLPKRYRLLDAGDALYAIGRPEALRKLDAAAGVGDTSTVDRSPEATSDDD